MVGDLWRGWPVAVYLEYLDDAFRWRDRALIRVWSRMIVDLASTPCSQTYELLRERWRREL